MDIKFIQSRDINDYSLLMNEILPDFGNAFLHTILVWCNLLKGDKDGYWEVWIVKNGDDTIGICGLYSLVHTKKEFWLGWLALIPSKRSSNIGPIIMEHLYKTAKDNGIHTILSYVDKDGKPLNFYKREGFEIIGTVKEYLEQNSLDQIDGDNFENPDDFVIRKYL